MANDNVIGFDDAKRPHAFKRQDKKIADIRKAFRVARADSEPKPKKRRRRKKKK